MKLQAGEGREAADQARMVLGGWWTGKVGECFTGGGSKAVAGSEKRGCRLS